jgi:hypothetical protein
MRKKSLICPNCKKTISFSTNEFAISRTMYMSKCPKCNVELTIPIYVFWVGAIIIVAVGGAGIFITNYLFPSLVDYDSTGKVIRTYKTVAVAIPSVLLGVYASNLLYRLIGKVVVRKPSFWES